MSNNETGAKMSAWEKGNWYLRQGCPKAPTALGYLFIHVDLFGFSNLPDG